MVKIDVNILSNKPNVRDHQIGLQVRDIGIARIFQRGCHIESYRGYSPDCHLNIVRCLLTKRLTKGGGMTCTPGPLPGYALEILSMSTIFDAQTIDLSRALALHVGFRQRG